MGVSVGSGSASVSLTGAGAGVSNVTNNSVLAIIRAADVDASGDVTLNAADQTDISATIVSVAASVGVSGGSGASATLTVSAIDATNS
ncbi:hypothetical protein EOD04_38165, partial [Mesorhizobium sp. M2C.T.Ca.TU.009.01.2.1]